MIFGITTFKMKIMSKNEKMIHLHLDSINNNNNNNF